MWEVFFDSYLVFCLVNFDGFNFLFEIFPNFCHLCFDHSTPGYSKPDYMHINLKILLLLYVFFLAC